MGAKEEAGKQVHRSASEWRQLIRAWKQSGKTKRVWCAEKGLSLESLRRWIKRFRGGEATEMPIVEVQQPFDLPGACPKIRIFINAAIQIELAAEASEELLRRVLRVAAEVSDVH
jgi:hypothetical protein